MQKKQKGYIGGFLVLAAVVIFAIGMLISFALSYVFKNEASNLVTELSAEIEKCERELPRNQSCVLIAIPESEVRTK